MEKEVIQIKEEFITLGQLLKFSGHFPSGGAAKEAISQGEILVNGEICLSRGKKITKEDVVTFDLVHLSVLPSSEIK